MMSVIKTGCIIWKGRVVYGTNVEERVYKEYEDCEKWVDERWTSLRDEGIYDVYEISTNVEECVIEWNGGNWDIYVI